MKLKKKVKRCLLIGGIFIVAGASLLLYQTTFKSKPTIKKATVLTEIKEYGYTLKSNKSKSYKKEFNNLAELLKKDINLLDYVIIHELCHFFEPNHSKKFWNLVGLAYPDYKNARKALKS